MATTTARMLDAYLGACQPFDWRRNNCALFAAGWVALVEGAAPAVPAVSGVITARRWLQARGHDLAGAVTQALQRAPVAAALARPGDLVLLREATGRQALCICAGRTAAGLSPAGVVHRPIPPEALAWRVPA